MLKAGREAKVHSSWINPNTEYEEATRDFVRALLSPEPPICSCKIFCRSSSGLRAWALSTACRKCCSN